MSNFNINDEQYKLINEGLERLFYDVKDDGDYEKMNAIIAFGKHLDKQRQNHEKEHQQMLNQIHDCYYDCIGEEPTDEQVTKIAVEIKEELYHEAQQWGWDDTEIADRIWNYINDYVKQHD
jgi:hypothetical protein